MKFIHIFALCKLVSIDFYEFFSLIIALIYFLYTTRLQWFLSDIVMKVSTLYYKQRN